MDVNYFEYLGSKIDEAEYSDIKLTILQRKWFNIIHLSTHNNIWLVLFYFIIIGCQTRMTFLGMKRSTQKIIDCQTDKVSYEADVNNHK